MKKFVISVMLVLVVICSVAAAASPTLETTLYRISDSIQYHLMDIDEIKEYEEDLWAIAAEYGLDAKLDDVIYGRYDGSERYVFFELPKLYTQEDIVYLIAYGESIIVMQGEVIESGSVMFDFEEFPVDSDYVMFIVSENKA